jgi:hypothetical protein
LFSPPAAASYVKVSVFPPEKATVAAGDTDSEPEPFGEFVTVTLADDARAFNVPPDVDFSLVLKVDGPEDPAPGASAPAPPPDLSPYVIFTLAPPASVRPETVRVWPDAATVPAVLVV